MNATQRQISYIHTLAKKAGKTVSDQQTEDLSKEEASRLIDSLQEETGHTPRRARVNDAMFGLAAKLVWQHSLKAEEPPLDGQFAKRVITVYKRLEQAKKQLKRQVEGEK